MFIFILIIVILMVIQKEFYILQPYHVGSKHGRSLALVIPAPIVDELEITPSTPFILQISQQTDQITLHRVAIQKKIKNPSETGLDLKTGAKSAVHSTTAR